VLKGADEEPFKAAEQLTATRNRIVHRGDDVEPDEALPMVGDCPAAVSLA
jgi:uncharacterized protein YutE (UPF0331/DUF86 family)